MNSCKERLQRCSRFFLALFALLLSWQQDIDEMHCCQLKRQAGAAERREDNATQDMQMRSADSTGREDV